MRSAERSGGLQLGGFMIVSCAPFRVSFAGGGSDIAAFYRRRRGAVLSCAIAKYSFIVVHPYFAATKYHLKYARTELVDRLDEIQHPILREALRMQDIDPGIEITSVADIPAGTGLGSSGTRSGYMETIRRWKLAPAWFLGATAASASGRHRPPPRSGRAGSGRCPIWGRDRRWALPQPPLPRSFPPGSAC
jgi:hypothetical protein